MENNNFRLQINKSVCLNLVLQGARTTELHPCHLPLGGRVLTVDGVLELDDVTVAFLQLPHVLHVKLDEFRERGKLLSAIQVVEVTSVLDLDVCHLSGTPGHNIRELNDILLDLQCNKIFFKLL